MNDRFHAGVSALSACFAGAVLLVRYAVTGGQPGRHRAPRPFLRPVQALVKVSTRCRFEGQERVHVETRVTGELICLSCGHIHGGVR